ncbi:hypothetical protein C8T65DRAFT_306568 [Cerioporus squamosus]|nr:hypothetical protein C8T65DRAFT_306568 [Cerioporus squamosus]
MLSLLSAVVHLGHHTKCSRMAAHNILSSAHGYLRRRMSYAPPKTVSFGVGRALQASPSSSSNIGTTLFAKEFSLADRVALVSGGRRGIGLEAALALAEAGARSVYCLDLPKEPGEEWTKARELAARMGVGNFEYISGDVREQEAMWKIGETIGDREGRLDVCVAAAGILGEIAPSLEYNEQAFQDIIDVNLKGVLFTAQAAGRQMRRFEQGGSIIMIASICGSVAIEVRPFGSSRVTLELKRGDLLHQPTVCTVAYHSAKAGVHQLARSMACELGSKGIRVNTVSPGFFKTKMVALAPPEVEATMANANPLRRIGHTQELRGVFAWLASDASSYCTGIDVSVDGGHKAW